MKTFTVVQTIIFVFNRICLNGADSSQHILNNQLQDPNHTAQLQNLVLKNTAEHKYYNEPIKSDLKAESNIKSDSELESDFELDSDLESGDNMIDGQTDNYEMTDREKLYVKYVDFKYWNNSFIDEQYKVIKFNEESELDKYWLKGRSLKVITHGWLHSDADETGIFSIKRAYLESKIEEYNIITVDWSRIAKKWSYFKVARKSIKVGIILGHFLIHLNKNNLVKPSDIHVLGNSMGAHVAGICGNTFYKATGKKIYRITGMDPSSPGYNDSWCPYWNNQKRLKPEDANFVDIIHTARGFLAISLTMGHADFYPNNGMSPQPMCTRKKIPLSPMACSHSSAYQYYCESVDNPKSFESLQCPSMNDYNNGKCDQNVKNYMGHYADSKRHGKFFLNTNSVEPYSFNVPRSLQPKRSQRLQSPSSRSLSQSPSQSPSQSSSPSPSPLISPTSSTLPSRSPSSSLSSSLLISPTSSTLPSRSSSSSLSPSLSQSRPPLPPTSLPPPPSPSPSRSPLGSILSFSRLFRSKNK